MTREEYRNLNVGDILIWIEPAKPCKVCIEEINEIKMNAYGVWVTYTDAAGVDWDIYIDDNARHLYTVIEDLNIDALRKAANKIVASIEVALKTFKEINEI